MKTLTNFSVSKHAGNLVILLAILLLFASCNGRKNEDENIAYSNNTLSLSRKLISVFNELDSIKGGAAYQNELIKILNDISPETYIMKVSQGKNENQLEYIYKLNAFRSFEKVFIAYNLQLDPGFSSQTSNIRDKVVAACNALDSVQLSESLKMRNDRIKHAIKNNKFKVDETIFEITDLYSELWNEEAQKWILFLVDNQSNIKKGIESIPVSAFNPEKIKLLVEDPYTNGAVLANLYKLNLIKERQLETNRLENEIQAISNAFGLISQLQGELMKRTRNQLKIQDLNSTIELLLID